MDFKQTQYYLFSIFAVVIMLGSGCSPSDSSAPSAATPKTDSKELVWYENKESEFAIRYPSEWEIKINDGQPQKPIVQFFSPPENDSDTFRENVNVIVGEKLKQDLNVNEVVNSLKANFQNFKLVKTSTEAVPMGKAITISYTADVSADQNGLDTRLQQTFVQGENHHYVITYTGIDDNFNTYESIVDKMIKSFKSL